MISAPIYPDYPDIQKSCQTLINASEFMFKDIITDKEYRQLIQLSQLFMDKFEEHKNKVVDGMINELNN